MASIFLITPGYEQLVRRHGLDRFDRVMRWHNGRRMVSHASRDVTQIEIDDVGQSVRLYIKREWQTYLKDRLFGWLTGLGWGTKSRHEWHVLEAMRRAGIGCAEPVALAERGQARPQGFLILRAIPGAIDLGRYLAERRPTMSVAARCRLAAHLGCEVARLHEAGIDHPDLYSKHILLSAEEEVRSGGAGEWSSDPIRRHSPTPLLPHCSSLPPHVCFIDLQRSSAGQLVSVSRRLRDLAALDATLPPGLASRVDRLVFLRSYLREMRLPLHESEAIATVRARSRRLVMRRKFCEMQSDERRRAGRFVQLDGHAMYADDEWLDTLRRARLDRFDAVLDTTLGHLLRRLPDRDNVRLELPAAGGPVRAYLKRHRGWYPLQWLRQRLFGRRVQLPGNYEAAQINRLERIGVQTMELIAFGQRFRSWGRGASFIITREVSGGVPLDDLLRREFAGPGNSAQRTGLRQLIRQIAQITRRFHHSGYNHQDLYCCHFLASSRPDAMNGADPDGHAEFDVHLIDLQRVQYRRWLRHRWVVKDLGQLNYSAPRQAISCTDRLRFLKSYLRVDRLGPRERRLVRQIVAKTRRIARHDARKRREFQ